MRKQTDPDVVLLHAAADPARLAILRQLSSAGQICACDFTECCGVSQPTVSHHLKVLRESGWVTAERRGNWIWYALRPEAASRLRAIAAELEAAVAQPAVSLGVPPSQPVGGRRGTPPAVA